MTTGPTDSQNPTPPSPLGGWSEEIVTLSDAVLMPPEQSAMIQECGVFHADGTYCNQSATWRGNRAMMTAGQSLPEERAKLAGRHLFAGQIWAHFGHFMAESLSRLWALDHIKEKLDGIVFLVKRPDRRSTVHGYQAEFLKLLGVDLPVHIITDPTEVEELLVPGQGFGLGAISAGTPSFRNYFANNFALDVKAEGPEGLYLSRTALGGLEGGVVLEEAIEASLARDGIETLHPQTLSIADQVARYRAAHRVVSLDGSALHLFGFVGQPHQRAAIILRRSSNVYQSIRNQIIHFCKIDPIVYDAIGADWVPAHKSRPGRYSFGELDFQKLGAMMHETDFGPPPDHWDAPRFRQIKQAMLAFAQEKDMEFNRNKRAPRGILHGVEAML